MALLYNFPIFLAGFPWDVGNSTIQTLNILSGDHSDVFNYFFTIVIFFGLVALCIGLLVKLISRS